MNNTTHTPGEWKITTVENEGCCIVAPGGLVCELSNPAKGDWRKNASLIAASPDLLKAAKELRDAFLDGCGEAKVGSAKRKRLSAAGDALEFAIVKAEAGVS